ncbi:MAG: hypothetical protein K0R61_1764 [Microvirga sp.]|jgi:hypothetical protein|nr:hypothetical protein [Microvirga sp.]
MPLHVPLADLLAHVENVQGLEFMRFDKGRDRGGIPRCDCIEICREIAVP